MVSNRLGSSGSSSSSSSQVSTHLTLSCVLPSCLPGVRYGPPGSRRMVYFVDDMNMPFVDKYDTQSAIELLRQMIDYHGW